MFLTVSLTKKAFRDAQQCGKALIGYWSVDSNSVWELERATAL